MNKQDKGNARANRPAALPRLNDIRWSDDDHGDWAEVMPGERMRVRLRGNETGGTLTVVESIVAPGGGVPLHMHRQIDELFIVTNGTVRFARGDETLDAPTGSVVFVPRGTPHAFVNRSAFDSELIAVFTPGGMDEMFVELAQTEPADIPALAIRYDTIIVGPPLQS